MGYVLGIDAAGGFYGGEYAGCLEYEARFRVDFEWDVAWCDCGVWVGGSQFDAAAAVKLRVYLHGCVRLLPRHAGLGDHE